MYWILRIFLLKKILSLYFEIRNHKKSIKNELNELEIKTKNLAANEALLYSHFQKKILNKEYHDPTVFVPTKTEQVIAASAPHSEIELKKITADLQIKIEKECAHAD